MKNCNWKEIRGFQSPAEYQRFCDWLESQVDAGLVGSVPTGEANQAVPYGFEEKWYRCMDSGQVWRLIAPEGPFRGSWEPVN